MAASSENTKMSPGKRSLEHPFHEHALTLREISKDCHVVKCSLCKQYSNGPTYCCEDCNFILHEACAQIEFPRRIQGHPSHRPDHPLKLDSKNSCYRCENCRFRVGVLTALATRLPHPQGVEEDTIRHFRHEQHLLSSFNVETAVDVQCGFCDEQICAGQVYGCRPCLYLLHEACARLTLEIQHPLHRHHPLTFLAEPELDECICRVCVKGVESQPAYCCKDCGFSLHVRCTLLTMGAQNDGPSGQEEEEENFWPCAIKYYFHQHLLTPLRIRHPALNQVRCTICGLKVSGGEAFACFPCKFFLHKACVEELPKEIKHFLHPQHPCGLILRQSNSYKCNSCLEDHSHIAFGCKDCKGFNLDPACALQTLSAVEDGADVHISHFAHEHPLSLSFTYSSSRTCTACQQSIDGVAYFCITCERFWLHRSCAELPQELERHEFHPDHPLTLSETPAPNFFCFGCHEKHGGLVFYCGKCDFYLGVQCASLNPTLKHPRHEHHLAYYVINPTTRLLQCRFCGKRCRYDFYCCMRCNFSLHGDCLHLPRTVNHRIDQHPLQLRDKYVFKDPNECLYCETSLNPEHGVYRCETCDFTAHIECMVSDYKKEVTGLETCGNDKLNQLNIQIETLRAKTEIMRRDVEAMEANRDVSVEELAEVGRKWKMVKG